MTPKEILLRAAERVATDASYGALSAVHAGYAWDWMAIKDAWDHMRSLYQPDLGRLSTREPSPCRPHNEDRQHRVYALLLAWASYEEKT